jgi:tetratricopeptide (TPR) repeat protein/tRNA A-37 threonylcarbamoyl transferase component Bud32
VTPDRRQHVEQLYHAALDQPLERRVAFVTAACSGEPAVAREVLDLLARNARGETVLDEETVDPETGVGEAAVRERRPTLAPGAQLGHFRVVRHVGRGGMGDVYEAEDLELGRRVALKVLPHAIRQDPAQRARLLREARAASCFAHPHIVTIHEIGHEGDVDFLVMEYVEGENLAARLGQGPLAVDEALVIGEQLAEALAAAHAHDLIHRDIKPANIVLGSNGRAKLLDFGLAKPMAGDAALSESGARDVTLTGHVVGTPTYMSPEQVRGEPLSAPTDIFSLTAVLYEAVTGVKAFPGASMLAVLHAVLTETPAPPSEVRPDVPVAFDAIVTRGLARDPAARYASAMDLLADLRAVRDGSNPLGGVRRYTRRAARAEAKRSALDTGRVEHLWKARWLRWPLLATLMTAGILAWWLTRAPLGIAGHWPRSEPAGASTAARVPLLVVRPFTAAPNGDRYFAAGLSEGVTRRLAGSTATLLVAAPQAAAALPSTASADEVLERLDAQFLLAGTIERGPKTVDATASLQRAGAAVPFWTRRFTEPASDVSRLESAIAAAVAEAVGGLTPASPARLASHRTIMPEAWDAYVRGRYALLHNEPDDAVMLLTEAKDRQPDYAQAYAALGRAYWWKLRLGPDITRREMVEMARLAGERALTLDPDLPEAHALMGDISFERDWSWTAAERHYRRALALDPADEDARFGYAMFLASRRRLSEAIEQMEGGRRFNPLSGRLAYYSGLTRYFARQYPEAVREFARARDLAPNQRGGLTGLGRVFRAMKRWREAEAAIRAALAHKASVVPALEARRRDREWHALRGELAQALAGMGRGREARAIVAELRTARERVPESVRSESLALASLGVGDVDAAFAWLDRAVDEHSGPVVFAAVDPRLDALRDDARFHGVLVRLALSPSQVSGR